MSELSDRLVATAKAMGQPTVRRLIVTDVLSGDRGCVTLEKKGWLLIPAKRWREVERAIPRTTECEWPAAMTFGLPLEIIPPNTVREREILRALVDEMRPRLTADSGGA